MLLILHVNHIYKGVIVYKQSKIEVISTIIWYRFSSVVHRFRTILVNSWIMSYFGVILTFWACEWNAQVTDHSMKATEQYFPVVLFTKLHHEGRGF